MRLVVPLRTGEIEVYPGCNRRCIPRVYQVVYTRCVQVVYTRCGTGSVYTRVYIGRLPWWYTRVYIERLPWWYILGGIYQGVYAQYPRWCIYPGVYARYTPLGTPSLHTAGMVNVPVDVLSAGIEPWAQKEGSPWVGASLRLSGP